MNDILTSVSIHTKVVLEKVGNSANQLFKLRQPTDPAQLERDGILIMMLDPLYVEENELEVAKKYLDKIAKLLYNKPLTAITIVDVLSQVINQANAKLYQLNQNSQHRCYFGLGLALIHKTQCYYVNIGGSRFFLRRGNGMRILDPRVGKLQPGESSSESLLGNSINLHPQVGRLTYKNGDELILASKQVVDNNSIEKIAEELVNQQDKTIEEKWGVLLTGKDKKGLKSAALATIQFGETQTDDEEEEVADEYEYDDLPSRQSRFGFKTGFLVGIGIAIFIIALLLVVKPDLLVFESKPKIKKSALDPKEAARIARQDSIERAKQEKIKQADLEKEDRKKKQLAFTSSLLSKTDKYLSILEDKIVNPKKSDLQQEDKSNDTKKKRKKKKKKRRKKTSKKAKKLIRKIKALRAEYNEIKDNPIQYETILEQAKLVSQFIDSMPTPKVTKKKRRKKGRRKKGKKPILSQKWENEHAKLVAYETYYSRLIALYYRVVMLMKTQRLPL